MIGLVDECAVTGRGRAQVLRIGADADAPEIQAIGVPAGLDRDVGIQEAVAVMGARKAQQLCLLVADRDEPLLAQGLDEGRGAVAVLPVRVVVPSARVVEEREERHHRATGAGLLCETQAVQAHARPVRCAVDAAPVERKVLADAGNHRE